MRAILVDWLVEVQENFVLYHETLYLAVKLVDSFLQNNPTPKEQLQLVGATALLIACKIEVILNIFFLNYFLLKLNKSEVLSNTHLLMPAVMSQMTY